MNYYKANTLITASRSRNRNRVSPPKAFPLLHPITASPFPKETLVCLQGNHVLPFPYGFTTEVYMPEHWEGRLSFLSNTSSSCILICKENLHPCSPPFSPVKVICEETDPHRPINWWRFPQPELSRLHEYNSITSSLRINFPGGSAVENSPAGEARDTGSISGLGKSSGGGNGNPLQHSCLENPVGRGTWWATACGVTKSGNDR